MSIRILQVVDTLIAGGAERMAVNIANSLPVNDFSVSLATTWKTGELQSEIAPHVRKFHFLARFRYDPDVVIKFSRFLQKEDFDIIHVHSNALIITVLAHQLSRTDSLLIWHDHYGRLEIRKRPVFLYWLALSKLDGVLSVSRKLENWAVNEMKVPQNKVWYLPNFVEYPLNQENIDLNLPGKSGFRIICVANIRKQKDHLTLVKAFLQVITVIPDATLIMVGKVNEPDLLVELEDYLSEHGLKGAVHFLGQRMDVLNILRFCDVAVLSSISEAFPLVLMEYGWAKLGVVSTRVGDCEEILLGGEAGLLVQPGDISAMAEAIQNLLEHPEIRRRLAENLHEHVSRNYSKQAVMTNLVDIYQTLLQEREAKKFENPSDR